jgi:hypothetical protein
MGCWFECDFEGIVAILVRFNDFLVNAREWFHESKRINAKTIQKINVITRRDIVLILLLGEVDALLHRDHSFKYAVRDFACLQQAWAELLPEPADEHSWKHSAEINAQPVCQCSRGFWAGSHQAAKAEACYSRGWNDSATEEHHPAGSQPIIHLRNVAGG